MLRHIVPATARRAYLLRQVAVTSIGTQDQRLPLLLRNFSLSPAEHPVPSNLTIDPRSSFAPQPKNSPRKDPRPSFAPKPKTSRKVRPANSQAQGEDEEDEDDIFAVDEDGGDDEAEDGNLFIPKPEVLYAKPLPDRLHVDIQTLLAPAYDSTVGTIWLDANVFGRDPIRVDLLKRAVLYYRNKKRGRRKAHTKTISEVSGSGRKLRPQKGQGRARVGHSRPSHFRGGAKAHGPKNLTDYGNTKLNKKVRRQAVCHALSQRLLEGNLIILNHLHDLDSYKTRELSKLLNQWGLGGLSRTDGASALILDSYYPEQDQDDTSVATHRGLPVPFYLAASNIPRIKVGNDTAASVYEILRHEKLVITLATLEKLESRLKNV